MNGTGGVATDRRPHSNLGLQHNKIINENEFPSLGAQNIASSGGFSPLASTSAQHSQYKESLAKANYGMTSDGPIGGPSADTAMRVPSGVWATGGATLMRSADPSLNNPEFQIQSEDFPALPGALSGGIVGSLPSLPDITSRTPENLMPSNPSEMLSTSGDNFCRPSGGEPPRGIVTHPDDEVSNIPPSMLADQFGMAGLVTYLRTVDNPSIVSLALGYDLTTLGLNLNLSERHLYTTFGGPWADNPVRPHELDVKVPDEYMTNAHIRDKLPPVKLNKLSEDVLFYLFYNCPGEVYQLAAACELYQRDWRFHKTDGVWLTRSQYGGMKEQTSTYEKGQYNVFDPLQWRKIPKELRLEYKELEERPRLPAVFQAHSMSGAQPAGPSPIGNRPAS